MDKVISYKPQFISTEPCKGRLTLRKEKARSPTFQDFEQNHSTLGSITEQQ